MTNDDILRIANELDPSVELDYRHQEFCVALVRRILAEAGKDADVPFAWGKKMFNGKVVLTTCPPDMDDKGWITLYAAPQRTAQEQAQHPMPVGISPEPLSAAVPQSDTPTPEEETQVERIKRLWKWLNEQEAMIDTLESQNAELRTALEAERKALAGMTLVPDVATRAMRIAGTNAVTSTLKGTASGIALAVYYAMLAEARVRELEARNV